VDIANEFHAGSPSVLSYKSGHAVNNPAKNKGYNFAIVLEFEDSAVSLDTAIKHTLVWFVFNMLCRVLLYIKDT
jgi:hypothetical protein